MSVYVDSLIDYGWRLGPSCHLTADTETELHEFAQSIGLKRSWADTKIEKLIHYDLVKSKRDLAIKKGAIELTRKEVSAMVRKRLNS
jgi:hypothetical protein